MGRSLGATTTLKHTVLIYATMPACLLNEDKNVSIKDNINKLDGKTLNFQTTDGIKSYKYDATKGICEKDHFMSSQLL